MKTEEQIIYSIIEQSTSIISQCNYLLGIWHTQSTYRPSLKLLPFNAPSQLNSLITNVVPSDEGADMKLKNATIRKRADKRWEIRYYLNKKQVSIYGKTQQECLKKWKDAKKQTSQTPDTTSTPISEFKMYTVYEWIIDEWLEKYKKPNITERYYKQIKHSVAHLKPIFNILLTKLEPMKLQETLNNIDLGRTRASAYAVIKEAFGKAIKLELISPRILAVLEIKKHTKQKRNALTKEQQTILLNALKGHKYENIYKFLLFTGVRPGELIKICKSDIDFVKRTIHIRGTKTENADRIIPLPNYFNYLREQEFERFCIHSTSRLNKELRDVCKSAGLPEFTLYNLRHTFATRLFENNIADKLIEAWMGHSNINFTKSHYIHISNEFSKENANKIDEIFNPDKLD